MHPGQLNLTNGIPITEYKIYNDSNGKHDLMLLKLPNPTNIRPIKLPSDAECRNRPQTVQIAGYAAKTTGPNNERVRGGSTTLQCADIPVVNCSRLRSCLQNRNPQSWKLYQHWFCGQSSTTDTSKGDSGGGVVHGCRIYGVHSFTGNHTHACVEAAGFIDVCNSGYKGWIKRIAHLVLLCCGHEVCRAEARYNCTHTGKTYRTFGCNGPGMVLPSL
ncbi:uncharacterized protein LOC121507794 [Cheilinus undulatus]|uniref:uncharacterized protein LOC121507794 n=1 Tax=Cheilinus undulatus TaxID=241271 RepID=UPI001BD6106B|nr:uncharacterized protein LOC121507794 [Cheilinus undulatus]